MRNPINRTSRKILTAIATAGIMLCSFGCQGPEEITEIHRLSPTDGTEYEVNLIMLSELSGRILPQKNPKITIVKGTDNNYCLKSKFDKDTSTCKRESYLTDIIETSDDGTTLFLNPYKGISNSFDANRIQCISKGDEYECYPYYSGMVMIEKIWNEIFDQNKTSIRIGNGDIYGVANGFSIDNDNIPTILTLNQIGFQVDTFGNHTFDDSDSLYWLRKHIDTATFSFTVSNMTNIIQNLSNVNTFKIIDIPPKKGDYKSIHVAVVGAVDTLLGDTISTGYMGTLTATSYCNTIYAMEDAYNLNARAFVILSHVFSYKPEHLATFIQTLHDALLNDDIDSICPNSRIIITKEMLEDAQKDRKQNGAKGTVSANQLRAEIRKEIYNSILAIFNEEGDTPIFSTITGYDEFLKYDGLDLSNTNLFLDKTKDDYVTNYYEIADSSRSFLDKYFRFEYTYTPSADDQDEITDKPILYIQFPARGTHTANVSFTLTKRDQNIIPVTGNRIANNYQAQLKRMQLVPVLSSGNTVIENDSVKEKYGSSECDKLLDNFKTKYNLTKCDQYFDSYILHLTKNEEMPSIEYCLNELKCLIGNERATGCDGPKTDAAMSTNDLEALFSCLYNVTLWDYDKEKNILEKNSICEFKNYTVAGENRNYETRAFGTFIGNFTTDIVMNALRRKAPESKIDFVIMNSGTVRDTSDFTIIDAEFLKDNYPFASELYKIPLTTQQVHDYIEYGLNPNTDGGFPIFSGIKVFYHDKNDEEYSNDRDNATDLKSETIAKKKIVEIWLTDPDNNVETPLYIESCDNNNSNEECIKKKTCCIKNRDDSNLCHDSHCKENWDKLDTTRKYEVVIPQYLASGGDRYPTYEEYTKENNGIIINGQAVTITGLIKETLIKDSGAEHFCTLKLSNGDELKTEQFLKHLIHKHLFTDKDIEKDKRHHTDLRNNPCVATQEELFKALVNSSNMGQNDCDYTPDAPEG